MDASREPKSSKLEVIGEEGVAKSPEKPKIKRKKKESEARNLFNFDQPTLVADVVSRAVARDTAFTLSRHLDHKQLIRQKMIDKRRLMLTQGRRRQLPRAKVKSLRNVNSKSAEVFCSLTRMRKGREVLGQDQKISFSSSASVSD